MLQAKQKNNDPTYIHDGLAIFDGENDYLLQFTAEEIAAATPYEGGFIVLDGHTQAFLTADQLDEAKRHLQENPL